MSARCYRTRAASSLFLALCTLFAAHTFDSDAPSRRASACPVVVEPKPLRLLYQKNERIVVARVGNTELVQVEEGYTSVRTMMHVLENVKGNGAGQTLYVNHWADENGQSQTFVKEDRLLLFLRPGEHGDGAYEIEDEEYGVKKLSDAELKIYLKRIAELSAILRRQAQPDASELVEWFVRCAEEPATRWEGAYELSASANADASQDAADEETSETDEGESQEDVTGESEETSAADDNDEESATPVTVEVDTSSAQSESAQTESAAGEGENGAYPTLEQIKELPLRNRRDLDAADPAWIKLLTESQKQRLADAFFAAENIGKGEQLLLGLIENYGDPRLLPFLMRHLRRVENAPPYEAELWVTIIGRAVADRVVKKLAVEYSEKATYYEHDVMAESTDEGEATEDTMPTDAESKDGVDPQDALSARKRSVLLREFIVQAERATQL
ncbi:MAG TPA: hypothetical protein VGW12_18915 [Pyrinomonadaceae bacterium]|nr:hypothetical protein [Pyrinomonadaceae bacterium]